MPTMRVLCFTPGQARPTIRHIDADLASMQSAVGGYIETVTLKDGLVIVCDEEGRLKGLPVNRIVDGVSICGPFFICRAEDDDFVELSLEEINRLRDQEFQRWQLPAAAAAI